ncbi:MAG: HAD family hydrolase [Muribaculum sp.]|nr:HAD family hydrolase [Muribaculum sp.]
MIKGIIFDYGGTLDSAGEHWSEVIYKAYAEAGVEVEHSDFRVAYVYAERELARTLHILPHHSFGDLLYIKVKIELEYLVREGLYSPDGVEAKAREISRICDARAGECLRKAAVVLEELKKTYPMVLVSNFYGNIETVLKGFGLEGYFKKIVESAVVGVRKPDPKIFELGCEALGLPPEEVAVVGDSYRKDIEPAKKIGCLAVWLKGKQWSEEEENITYEPTITDLQALPAILREENGKKI